MNNDIVKGLIRVANSLDSKGFGKEADQLDRIMRKLSQFAGSPEADENSAIGEWQEKWDSARNRVNEFISARISWSMDETMAIIKSWPWYNRNIRGRGGNIMGVDMARYPAWDKLRRELLGKGSISTMNQRSQDYKAIVKMVEEAHGIYEATPTSSPEEEASPAVTRQAPSPKRTKECKPNGQPLIRLPGDNTYGYQLTDDGKAYRAYRLSDCKYLGTFDDEKGTNKIKAAAPKAAPSEAGETPSETSQGSEITDETVEEVHVAPPPDAMSALQDLYRRVDAMKDIRRFEQTAGVVQEAADLLGIKNITPFAPGVRRKYLLRLIERGIKKLQGDSADDLFMSEAASRSSERISKFASLLSGEFGGLDKKVRR